MNAIKKIYAGFASLLALLVLLSCIMVYQAFKEAAEVQGLFTAAEKRELADDMKLDVVQVQQWLTDISATRGAAGFDDGYQEAEKFAALFKEHSNKLKTLFTGTETEDKLRKLDGAFDSYYSFGKQMAAVYIKEGPVEGNKMMEKFDPIAEEMTNSLEVVVREVMGKAFPVVSPDASVTQVTSFITAEMPAVFVDLGGAFEILTKYDLVQAIAGLAESDR